MEGGTPKKKFLFVMEKVHTMFNCMPWQEIKLGNKGERNFVFIFCLAHQNVSFVRKET